LEFYRPLYPAEDGGKSHALREKRSSHLNFTFPVNEVRNFHRPF
jgi:hypothetical protein